MRRARRRCDASRTIRGIGCTRTPSSWSQEPEPANVHDFRTDTLGRAVPYGIYDLARNRGTVYVGQSADTPRFAIDMIARWWTDEGRAAYPAASELLILADSGGSNSARSRVWKQQLQEQLCDRHGLAVTVCHYPTGCSKWNPIEHRLFGPISQTWAGHPLVDWATLPVISKGPPPGPASPSAPPSTTAFPDRRVSPRCRHGRPQPHQTRRLSHLELHLAPTPTTCSRLACHQPESGTCSLTDP